MSHSNHRELETLSKLMKTAENVRMYQRYQAILFYLTGHPKKEIAYMIGRSEKTVYNYVNDYKDKGIEGLTMGKSPGAPRKLTTEQEQKLVQVITNKVPMDVGFPAKYNWTLAIIVSFIEKTWNQSYTLRGASRLLHELGLSYTKPTYTLAKADPEKQKAFIEETFPTYKKTAGW